jgi:DNA repair photolyase
MNKRATFITYHPKTILNKCRHADHWFWTRYSAYPYKGCQHGCEFCYCRERKYAPFNQPDDFAYTIHIKENAPDLLRKALSRTPIDLICVGDYQPAERKFRLTRRMLEVCSELNFPVFILTRSPLVVRDLDLLREIDQKARAVVLFSAISTPDSVYYHDVARLERLSPAVEKRFYAMEELSKAGILTGTCFMPILPLLCDDDKNLENVVKWTSNHGGKFVLSSSLTLADQQRDYFLNVLSNKFPDLVEPYKYYINQAAILQNLIIGFILLNVYKCYVRIMELGTECLARS